ncbi:hypothetical protein BE21_39455 [Sorangium cellulosum]|uniref:Uncharacterized protein n=1 Tax=Sorangium cellulosum TaxID=56 RepID=A0A150TLU4_SORCE|nr:hypothetical protein BE21_39455 [Sorangium cellulosum]
MRVRFSQDVLEREDDTAWRALARIVDAFAEGRHVWEIDDPDAIEASRWIAGDAGSREARRTLEIMRKSYTEALYASPNRRAHTLVIVVGADLAPDQARRCLEAPAYVVVENRESDGAFLKAMVRAFGRSELETAIARGWVDVVHAGGFGELEKRVNEIIGNVPGPCRIFVLCDSDRMHPGHNDTEAIKALHACCAHHGVPGHVLHKRSIESYLPKGSLKRQGKRDMFEAFFDALNDAQRDHYNMKEGFKRPKTREGDVSVPPEHKGLFDGLAQDVLRKLCGGFGDHAWRLFLTTRSEITAAAVEERCATNPGEISRLLDIIEALV